MGEIIPARLAISSTEHTKQWIATEYCEADTPYPTTTTPELSTRKEGAALSSSACFSHGWGNEFDLATEPWIRTMTLNHRFLLDQPGTYFLTWTGHWGQQSLISNKTKLILLPRDPAWEANELARADGLIDGPPEHRYEGCVILRYLGTPAAELAMARRYGIKNGCDLMFGIALRNAKDRDAVLKILEARLTAPDQVISLEFLRTISLLSLYRAHPEWYEAATRQIKGVVPNSDRIGPYWNPYLVDVEDVHNMGRLTAALPSKQPAVRARCIEALLQFPRLHNNRELPPDIATAILQQLPGVFRLLNDFDQNQILENLWPGLASPAMVPLLVDLIDHDGNPMLRGRALGRLNEVAPEKAREYVLRDLRAPHLSFPIEVLGLLPDKDLPEVDSVLLEHVTQQLPNPHGADLHGALILLRRYGSPAIEPQVRVLFDENFSALDCGERFDLMAYFHRVDPSAAEAFLSRMRFEAPPSACSIHALATRYWSPAIEAIELAQLDESAEEVRASLDDLRRYASPKARITIFDHFQRWYERWRSQAPQISGPNAYSMDRAALLDTAYLHALIFAYGWNTPQEQIIQIGKLCLTEGCRNEATQRSISFSYEYTFIVLGSGFERGGPPNFGFAPYGDIGDLERMKHKLSLYPAGTDFSFDTRGHSEKTIHSVQTSLGSWLTANGYSFALYRE